MKITLLLCALLCSRAFAQPAVIGQPVPPFNITLLQNAAPQVSSAGLKGKIVILEFWAPWCGPCVTAMPKLDALQKKYKNKLQVIAVSSESPARIGLFMKNRPFSFWHGVDTARELNNIFPHRIIPHSIIINEAGVVVAITDAGEITPAVIERLLKNKTVALKEKKDDVVFDIDGDYFKMDTLTKENFIVQPGLAGTPSFSKEPNQGIFAQRRISTHNMTLTGLYRLAFEKSIFRLVYEGVTEADFDYKKIANLYCTDLIIAQPDKKLLHQTMAEKLLANFEVKARLEKRRLPVVVLRRHDSTSFALAAASHAPGHSARSDGFESEGATLDDFAGYLEGFGIFGKPVVNETGIAGSYVFSFSYTPEQKGSFKQALRNTGLAYSMEEREVEVLVIYK
jgi:uncharacterized protein (TIGR03435 family)